MLIMEKRYFKKIVPTDGLDDTRLTGETEYSINFSEQQENIPILGMLLVLMHMKLFYCQIVLCLLKM